VLRSLSERRRWGLAVALGALALALANLWWVTEYRKDYPFDLDEAGYATFAWIEHLGLQNGGLHGWWEALQAQAPHAPLLPGLTSLALSVEEGSLQGFGVLSAFLVLLGLAVYGIAERIAGPRLGALAALVSVTAPGAFAFSREFIFALPTAALLASGVYSLMRSDGLRLRRWAIAAGAALGLMLLARSMAIAFVPGVLVAGTVCLIARSRGDLAGRALNLSLLVLTGAGVAATWYIRNWGAVVDYLTGYGYGAQSQYFGQGDSIFSWARLRSTPVNMVEEDLLLPLALLVLAGLATVAVALVRRAGDAPDPRAFLRRLAATDALVLAIVVGAGAVALTTSQNSGKGFTLPIALLTPALAVLALRLHPGAARPAAAALIVLAGFNTLSASSIWPAAAADREVTVPAFGRLPVSNGVPRAVSELRPQAPGPETRFDERDRGWPRADRALSHRLLGLSGPNGEKPLVVFASHSRALNTNTLQLATVMESGTLIPLTQLRAEPDDSTATYLEQLSDPELGLPTVMISMSRSGGDYPPHITQPLAVAAARRLGFRRIGSMGLPDGRILRIWRKGSP
jgi:4-amino-4-deoxy-L-arabinose transferase-like glycosyltransferase